MLAMLVMNTYEYTTSQGVISSSAKFHDRWSSSVRLACMSRDLYSSRRVGEKNTD